MPTRDMPLAALALASLLAGASTAEPTATASGRVYDAAGHPVAGARVKVASSRVTQRYGPVTTDEQGRFAMAVPGLPRAEVEVNVDADGFEPAGWNYEPRDLASLVLTLDRKVDQAYLDRLLAQRDPVARREAVVLLLSAATRPGFREEGLFPYLGRLRADLRVAAQKAEPGAHLSGESCDRARTGLRDEAQRLLAFWGDPGDRSLTAPWRALGAFSDAPTGIVGAELWQVCEAWADLHFRAEKSRTSYFCLPPAIDPAGTRAMIRFEVRYARFAYELLLFAVRDGKVWRLQSVMRGFMT